MYIKKITDTVKNFKIHLTENDILNFLKNTNRFPFRYQNNQPSVEIIDNNKKNCNFFTNNYIDFNKFKKEYDKGLTAIISNIFDLNETLKNLEKKLLKLTNNNYLISANFYFGKGNINNISFEKHKHNVDVCIKQIYGTQKWHIWNNENDYNEITCKKNDVIFLKKDCFHQVVKALKRLTLNINFKKI